MRLVRGFTLIELIVVIAIIAIIATMAAPSFSRLLDEQRLNQSTRALVNTLAQARSQAALSRTLTTVNLNSTNANTGTIFNWSPTGESNLVITDQANTESTVTTINFRVDGTTTLNTNLNFHICNSNLKTGRAFTLSRTGTVIMQSDIQGSC